MSNDRSPDQTTGTTKDHEVTQAGRLTCPKPAKPLLHGWGPLLISLSFGTLPLTFVAGPSSAADESTTPKASCIVSKVPPTIAKVQTIAWPINLADTSATGVVTVKVDLDEHAKVRKAEVDKTSGDFSLDQEARRLASRAHFTLADGTCMAPVSYGIEYDFVNTDAQ